MKLDEFWSHIELARKQAVPHSFLFEELLSLPEVEILSFIGHWFDIRGAAQRDDIWDTVVELEGGCSDDSFHDAFLPWLIGQGREYYERVLAEPKVLSERIQDGLFYEALGAVVFRLYKEKTGRDLDYDEIVRAEQINQENWQEDWECYLKTWKVVCTHLLGWTDNQTENWAAKYKGNILLGHEAPCWYLSSELVPAGLRKRVRPDHLEKLSRAVQNAIERPPNAKPVYFPNEDPSFDWHAAKQRVRSVFEDIG